MPLKLHLKFDVLPKGPIDIINIHYYANILWFKIAELISRLVLPWKMHLHLTQNPHRLVIPDSFWDRNHSKSTKPRYTRSIEVVKIKSFISCTGFENGFQNILQ